MVHNSSWNQDWLILSFVPSYTAQSSKIKLSFLALKMENDKKIYTKSCAAMNMHNSPIIDVLSWYWILFHKAAYACHLALSFGPQFCRASRLLLLGCFWIYQSLASLSEQLWLSIRCPQDRSLEPQVGSQPLLPTSPPRCVQFCPSCKSSQEVLVYMGGRLTTCGDSSYRDAICVYVAHTLCRYFGPSSSCNNHFPTLL